MRVKVPHQLKLMPHKHPKHQICAVVSDDLFITRGEPFDPEKSQEFPPDSVPEVSGEPWRSQWAQAGQCLIEAIRSVTAVAPVMILAATPERHNQRFLTRRGSGNLPFSRLAGQTRIRCAGVTRYEHLTWTVREVTAMSKQVSAQLVTAANSSDSAGV